MTDKTRFEAIKEDLAKAMVSRDPFARQEIHRHTVENTGKGCDWCGGSNARGKLHEYQVETDGGSKHPIKGKFCSKDCMESYHG